MRSRHLIHTLVCLTCAFLVGCLDFGSGTELLAPKVTAQYLQQVSSVTGIQFPDGSPGLAYLYQPFSDPVRIGFTSSAMTSPMNHRMSMWIARISRPSSGSAP